MYHLIKLLRKASLTSGFSHVHGQEALCKQIKVSLVASLFSCAPLPSPSFASCLPCVNILSAQGFHVPDIVVLPSPFVLVASPPVNGACRRCPVNRSKSRVSHEVQALDTRSPSLLRRPTPLVRPRGQNNSPADPGCKEKSYPPLALSNVMEARERGWNPSKRPHLRRFLSTVGIRVWHSLTPPFPRQHGEVLWE